MTENQEGKNLNELAGEGHIATPETDDGRGMVEIDKDGNIIKTPQSEAEAEVEKALNPPEDVVERCPQTEEEIMKPVDFKDGIFGMRGDIELVKSKVKNWMGHPELLRINLGLEKLGQREEMDDNLKLAYRHLEDARMRLGKAIQAYDGGKSCYPR